MIGSYFAVVMPWGRVGSNLVISTLMRQCGINIANEPTTVIRSMFRSEGPEGFCSADIMQTDYANSFPDIEKFPFGGKCKKPIGMKISHQSLVSPMMFYSILKERNFKIVSMVRNNHIKAAISQLRAEERARSNIGSSAWSIPSKSAMPEPSRIDPRQVLARADRFMQNTVQMQGYLDYLFPDRKIEVEYEDINGNPKAALLNIANYLGYELPEVYSLPHRKATSNNLSDSVVNWREVETFLSKTKFRYLLDSL